MKPRISRDENSRGVEARESKVPVTLPEVVPREGPQAEDSEDPEEVVARAEARAREEKKKVGTKRSRKCCGSKSEYAASLHRQADILHHRLDYEAALVLYYRASQAYPRDPSHLVAARRTSAAIISATNPVRLLKGSLPKTTSAAALSANYCPETAAIKAKKLVEESSDPATTISQILKYFDSRKNLWRDPANFQERRRTRVSRSKTMLEQSSNAAVGLLKNLQRSFASGDSGACLKLGQELVDVSSKLPDRYGHQVAARHYLAITQTMLGRHDRAVDQVSEMVRLAKESGDAGLRLRSLTTIGMVHLNFRHLDAAARAWEGLVADLEDAVPKAWLLHEIGRCYYETKRYSLALKSAARCLEYADERGSTKWQLHGNLLTGQTLVELGRLGEAVRSLRLAADAAREMKDAATREYIDNLIDRLTDLLKRVVFEEENAPVMDQRIKRNDPVHCTKSEYKLEGPKLSNRSPDEQTIRSARIESSRHHPGDTDRLTRPGDFDEICDVLTSRTRVIRKRADNDTDFSWNLTAREVDSEERASRSDSDESNRTGTTYVLDELGKCSIIADGKVTLGTSDNASLVLRRADSEESDKIADDRPRDKSKDAEYLRNRRAGGLEIL